MRWIFGILGTLFIVTGGIAFYFSMHRQGEDATLTAIRQALKSQVKATAFEVEQGLEAQTSQIDLTLSEVFEKKLKPKNLLEQTNSPLLLLVRAGAETKELKSKKASVSEELRVVAENFFAKPEKIALWDSSEKSTFVLFQGAKNELRYVAVYRQESLFPKLRTSTAIRPWVALNDGSILFHNVTRHVGVKAASVRPVAQGIESLSHNQSTEMLANYVGFDGTEILGAWVTLPKWGLIVGSEWPSLGVAKNQFSVFSWVALVGLILGAFFLGSLITPRPIQVTAAQRELKDISHEARAFIKRAEKQADGALRFAQEREEQCAELEAKAREQLAIAERTRWIFERTESFLEEIVDSKDEGIVWPTLATYLSNMAVKAPVLVYTYSASSCSLMPQAQVGLEDFPESAQRYLKDSRLLVGDIQQLHRIEQTSAYAQWRARWERFMPLEAFRLFFMPYASPTGSRGVILFLLDPMRMSEQEISSQRDLWSLFAYRAAWLYDMKRRLLQSKHVAKRTDKATISPDRTRDRSKTT